MIYGATLFKTQLTVGVTGALAMNDDEALSDELPVLVESIADGVRTVRPVNDLKERSLATLRKKLDATPSDRTLIKSAVDVSAELGRWKDAMLFQQRLVDGLKNDLKAMSELPDAYLALARYQILARNFAGALRSAEEGRLVSPNSLQTEEYRAHALLFLGRIREAEAIYRAHIGRKIREGLDTSWEETILKDFDFFERNGLTQADIARLRKILKSALGN
jgi:tetratricopeptide (TPR) repeat protein